MHAWTDVLAVFISGLRPSRGSQPWDIWNVRKREDVNIRVLRKLPELMSLQREDLTYRIFGSRTNYFQLSNCRVCRVTIYGGQRSKATKSPVGSCISSPTRPNLNFSARAFTPCKFQTWGCFASRKQPMRSIRLVRTAPGVPNIEPCTVVRSTRPIHRPHQGLDGEFSEGDRFFST